MSIFHGIQIYENLQNPDLSPEIQREWVMKCKELATLLRESRRKHYHCEESTYCCSFCRHPDHGLQDDETLGEAACIENPGVCSCGADQWNAKINEAIA